MQRTDTVESHITCMITTAWVSHCNGTLEDQNMKEKDDNADTVMRQREATTIVWCIMSFLPFSLPKLILLAFWPSWGSNKPKILGFNFSHPSTPFYATIFKKAGSKLNMPHIDPSKLHTITNFVSEPMFLIMRNVLLYVKVILEWQPSWKSNMAPRKCDR